MFFSVILRPSALLNGGGLGRKAADYAQRGEGQLRALKPRISFSESGRASMEAGTVIRSGSLA